MSTTTGVTTCISPGILPWITSGTSAGGAGHWQEHSRGGGWAGLRGPAAEHEQWHQAPHGRRAFLLLGIWASFLIGALLGGAATSRFGVWVLLLPLLILLALAVFSRPQSANPDSSA